MPRDHTHPAIPDERDQAYLWSMHKVLGELADISKGCKQEDLHTNVMLQRAIERCIEIIGEMANKVSTQTRTQHAQINWTGIINQRHVIAHTYEGINYDLLWDIIINHAPTLRDQIESILPPEPKDPLPEN